MWIPDEIYSLIKGGALFVFNDSGGKDSQAMKIKLLEVVPKSQCIIVHADLGEVEWPGNIEHIEKYSQGVPVYVVRAKKTFFEMVDHRKMFPSPSTRQCTSDLKRGPIQKFINNYAKENGFQYVVNCMGIRAEESPGRAKKQPFRFMPDRSAKHRQQYEWLAIHDMLLPEVWETIDSAGQKRHYAYDQGMSRLSCCFCIMASDSDLKTAGKLQPDLAARYIAKEKELNFTLSMSRRPLEKIINS